MDRIILDVNTLPTVIRKRFGEGVREVVVSGEDERIVLEPAGSKASEKEHSSLWGMFSDGKLSSEKFLADKRRSEEETEF